MEDLLKFMSFVPPPHPDIVVGPPEEFLPIDPNKPRIPNADGSFSTERSFSFGENGKEILIPRIVNGVDVGMEQAIKEYRNGNNPAIGIFDTPEEATAFSKQRSGNIGKGERTMPDTFVKPPNIVDILGRSKRVLVDPETGKEFTKPQLKRLMKIMGRPPRNINIEVLPEKAEPTDFDTIFDEAGSKTGTDPNMLRAIAKQESKFNPTAVSSKGAIGVMQVMLILALLHCPGSWLAQGV